MALKNPAFWLVDVRSVKTRLRTVVRKFPYSDRLFESSELATTLICFDKKKLQQFFSNTLLKRKKATDKEHKIPKRYRRNFELKFCGVKSKNKVNFKAFTQKRSHVKTCILNVWKEQLSFEESIKKKSTTKTKPQDFYKVSLKNWMFCVYFSGWKKKLDMKWV